MGTVGGDPPSGRVEVGKRVTGSRAVLVTCCEAQARVFTFGAPGRLSQVSVCPWLRSRTQGFGMEPHSCSAGSLLLPHTPIVRTHARALSVK